MALCLKANPAFRGYLDQRFSFSHLLMWYVAFSGNQAGAGAIPVPMEDPNICKARD